MTETGKIGAESRAILQDLMLLPQKATITRKESIKKKRENMSQTLLKAQGVKYGTKCTRCELNCVVKHAESVTFWAAIDGIEPEYCLDQRDEAITMLRETGTTGSREEIGNIVNSELEYWEKETGESRESVLEMMTGYKNCPKQGHLEKTRIKKKRRTK